MPQFAAKLSTMYAEHAMLDRFAAAASAGVGELHYPYLLALIDALGYAGAIGCEYRPRAGTSAGLAWFEPWKDSQR